MKLCSLLSLVFSIQEDLSLDGEKKPADLSGNLQGWSLAMSIMQKAVPALTNLFNNDILQGLDSGRTV